MAWDLLRRQPSQTTHLRPGTPPHGPGTRPLQPGSQPNSSRHQPTALAALTTGRRPRSRPRRQASPHPAPGKGTTRKHLARSCPVQRPDGPTARLPACHSRVRFRQTHPCKFAPSPAAPAPLPTDGPTRTSTPETHLRAAPPSTGTRRVKGMRPTRPSTQRPGPGPLTNPTTRQRPHARLRLGCAPPRGPPY